MAKRLLRTTTVIALGAVAFLVAQLVVWKIGADAALALDTSQLVDGDAETVAARLERDSRRFGAGRRTFDVLAWARLLAGSTESDDIRRAASTLNEQTPIPARILLGRLLRERKAKTALRVVTTAAAPGASAFRSIETAARLELGEVPLRVDLPRAAPDGSSALPRIESIYQLRARGARQILFDRHGRLLGSVGGAGEIDLVGEADSPDWRAWLESLELPAEAAGVRLSVDLELSRLAREALIWQHGSIVVLDVHSGQVLAAVSDQRTARREGAAFLDQRREPASIAKLVTASAALRAGLDLDGLIDRRPCRGSVAVDGGYLYCPVVAGDLDGLDQALALSCNTSFARIGLELGAKIILDEYRRFGFVAGDAASAHGRGQSAKAASAHGRGQSAETASARVRDLAGGERWLAELAIGLDHAELSPLHAARMAAVFGNGGELVEPQWVSTTDGYLGLTPGPATETLPAPRIVSEQHAARLLQAMRAVVTDGTARGVEPADFAVAMKTGTASEPRYGFHVNYIGVAPWPEPQVAFAIRVTDRRTSRSVRNAAKGVTARFLRRLAAWSEGSTQRAPDPTLLPRTTFVAGGG